MAVKIPQKAFVISGAVRKSTTTQLWPATEVRKLGEANSAPCRSNLRKWADRLDAARVRKTFEESTGPAVAAAYFDSDIGGLGPEASFPIASRAARRTVDVGD